MSAPTEFPPIRDSFDIINEPDNRPKDIIQGIFGRHTKMVIGGSTKTFKTWIQTDLGFCHAFGIPWLGMQVNQGPTLMLNLEVRSEYYQWRLKEVAKAKKIKIEPKRFDVWDLKGYAKGYASFFDGVTKRVLERGYSLTQLDPVYKILGTAQENNATDIADVCNRMDQFICETQSALAFCAHFPKGNMSERDSIDRISGSGVFARDPDTIIVITRHKENNCFTVEFTLRNHAHVEPFVIRWQYPLMVRADDLDPKDLKEARQSGRPEKHHGNELLSILPETGCSFTDWSNVAERDLGVSKATFKRKLKVLVDDGLIEKDQKGMWLPVNIGSILEEAIAKNHANQT